MGRRPWAPDDQLAWLKDKIAEFHEAQGKDQTKTFFNRVQQEYFDTYWKDPATGEQRDSVLDQDGNLITKGKRRELVEIRMRSREGDARAGDHEVKQEVEDYRDKGVDSCGIEPFLENPESADLLELHRRARSIQDTIDSLPRMLKNVLERVEAQTGWKGTILVGGPRPDTGKFSALYLHQGRTLNLGNVLPDATAKWEEVEKVFNQFLLFLAQMLKSKLVLAVDIAKQLKEAYMYNPDVQEGQDSTPASATTSRAVSEISETAGTTGKKRPRETSSGEKDYEDERLETIAKNKQLLQQLGLEQLAKDTTAPKPRAKKREKSAPKAVDAPTPRTTRSKSSVQPATTTSSSGQATETSSGHTAADTTSGQTTGTSSIQSTSASPVVVTTILYKEPT
ncbi:hypothetical protein FKP32DRAFT_1600496 [Trametes sanguinea]|nr:hypothetical protein FKP32DRAFT_1600496 [Trametes sanguinea]